MTIATDRLRLTDDTFRTVVARAAGTIRRGGTIVYPTDTIYGIGADATSADAVEAVFAMKERDRGRPLLVLADSMAMALRCTRPPSLQAEALLRTYWPGPVTFILRAGDVFPSSITGGTGTIGIRVPRNRFCTTLAALVGKPIISTSANLSGMAGGTDVESIAAEFEGKVDLIVDAGSVNDPTPSTVVDITGELPRIVRRGAVEVQW